MLKNCFRQFLLPQIHTLHLRSFLKPLTPIMCIKHKNFQSSSSNVHHTSNQNNNFHHSQHLERENIYTVPNGLCVLRMLSAPLMVYTLATGLHTESLILFTFAGLTDLADGLIARKFKGQRSKLGSILDPLADKIFVSTLFITLAAMDRIPAWLTVIIISRDVILIMASAFLRYKSLSSPRTLSKFFNPQLTTIEMNPSLLSKINTTLQLLYIGSTLLIPLTSLGDVSLMGYFPVIMVTTTLCSGIHYALSKNSYRFISHRKS
ncbi:cardiolipin synthase [Brevipalpus obovatus]|uniref:cardiolipin synthase n=1 Tax=Brevipalpus obovatus TaxID=246614 RepID=UPI003D9EFACD